MAHKYVSAVVRTTGVLIIRDEMPIMDGWHLEAMRTSTQYSCLYWDGQWFRQGVGTFSDDWVNY